MWRLLSFALLVISSAVAVEEGRIFSRDLAETEGFELTDTEKLVNSFITVMDHITRNKKDPQTFNGDHLLNVLKKNRNVPFLKTLEERFQAVHDESKTSVYSLLSLMNLWEEIAKEANIDIDESRTLMVQHEMFDTVAQRMSGGNSHKGSSAFGKGSHLKK